MMAAFILVVLTEPHANQVTVFFAGKLYRGNRATKIDAAHLDAFASPNLAPLAVLGTGISLDWGAM
jgi:L-asparaginase/Glu-tRNA(Gln) amidotransferase subunit D